MPEQWEVPPPVASAMHKAARDLRQRATTSEDILWGVLRDRKLAGRKFRRQEPIGPFVVDFYCASEKLAIEVDGGVHDKQQEADQERQRLIESLGIRFIRFTNDEVEHSLPSVIGQIRSQFKREPG